MRPEEASELRDLSSYSPESAGGIMTPAYVAVTADATADAAIAAIRQLVDDAETVNYVYVIGDDHQLLGVLSLYRLLLSPGVTPVRELMAPSTVRVRADADREVAARLLTDRNLLAIPVVDENDRILGIITEDDVADVLEAEATEDIERLGGSEPLNAPYRSSGVFLLFRKRVVWLLLLFVAEAYTGTVLRDFQDELSSVVALSFFIPLLIGTGGNMGSQTVTLVVRAMALGEVTLRDVGWIIFKEMRVGLALGAVMAVVAFGRAWLLGVGTDVGEVVALTILAICLWSATVAAALPLAAPGVPDRPSGRLGPAHHDPRRRDRSDHLLHDRADRPVAVTRVSSPPSPTSRPSSSRRSRRCPSQFRDQLGSVAIVIEDEPTPAQLAAVGARGLYGLYQGVPRTAYGAEQAAVPSKITIFRGPLERTHRTPDGAPRRGHRDRPPRDRPPLRDQRRAPPRDRARAPLGRARPARSRLGRQQVANHRREPLDPERVLGSGRVESVGGDERAVGRGTA